MAKDIADFLCFIPLKVNCPSKQKGAGIDWHYWFTGVILPFMKLLPLLSLLVTCQAILAGDFQPKIDLGGVSVREADAVEGRSPAPSALRKKISITAGRKTPLKWGLSYGGSRVREDVLVHFYVVKEGRPGEAVIREVKPDAVQIESALTMDFHGGDGTKAEVALLLQEPGFYMLRLEAFAEGETLVSATVDLNVEEGR